jgi:hypothetical protein
MIIIENETKYKSQISWDSRCHTLRRFCGPFENHIYGVGLKLWSIVMRKDTTRLWTIFKIARFEALCM